MYRRAAFIFRRDLRLDDNVGLRRAIEESQEVVPVYIFDPRQSDPAANPYFSARAFGFLCRSLRELDAALRERGSRLYVFEGDPTAITTSLIEIDGVEAVYVNGDVTVFARTRDESLRKRCEREGASFIRCDDVSLAPLEEIRTQTGDAYSVFTPFMRRAASYPVPVPRRLDAQNFVDAALRTPTVNIPGSDDERGGRSAGLDLIERLRDITGYDEARDIPGLDGTSRLSAHHTFGTISIRETYHSATAAGVGQQFIAELYWRDFYLYIALHFPHVFGRSFLPWGDHIEWVNDEAQFDAWKEGKTGVPIVDAGMRQLADTGWMHNRARMIAASYLTKNLLIDWRWGERYFAQQLVDYDPPSNNGGWQWSASVGADPRPIRIFNPYVQAQRFDPRAVYIKQWVAELADAPVSVLTDGKTQDLSGYGGYPEPIIDQKASYHRAIEAFRAAKESHRTM